MNTLRPHSARAPVLGQAEIAVRKPGQRDRLIELTGNAPIGRAYDNAVVINDDNVSRYHAVIEAREDGFWLIDLESRNGAQVNGDPILSERKLRDGDVISVGGPTVLEFHCDDSLSRSGPGYGEQSNLNPAAGGSLTGAAPAISLRGPVSPPRLSIWWIAAAIAIPVTIIGVTALALSGAFSSSKPDPGVVHIIGVHSGDTISTPTLIRTDASAETVGEIAKVTYQLDDIDLATVKAPPYETELNPAELAAKLPNASVSNHVLSLIVEDKDGARRVQPDKVVLSFAPESNASRDNTGEPISAAGAPEAPGADVGTIVPSSNDVSYMADALARQISKKTVVFAPELVDAIRIRTKDYRFNYADDARRANPREIANAFNDKGIDPIVGLVLAMSRSKFRAATGAEGTGLWQLPTPVLTEFAAGIDAKAAYSSQQGDAVAATYTKALFGLFDPEDFMFAIACYGMTTAQAGEVRAKLNAGLKEGNSHDFWTAAQAGRLPKEGVDRVISFFAAGIVGEYPEKFGMHSMRLSELYY